MPEPSLRPERVDDTPSLAVPEEIAHCCFGAKCVDLVRRKLGVVNDPSYFCATWQCDAWVGYAFAALCLALLVYSFSQDGARDAATWVITLGFGITPVIIGYGIRYILGGQKA